MFDENFGQHGCRVIRSFSAGPGQKYVRGAILGGETVLQWPLKNRIALHKTSKIEVFSGTSIDAVLDSADEAPKAKKSKAKPKAKPKVNPKTKKV